MVTRREDDVRSYFVVSAGVGLALLLFRLPAIRSDVSGALGVFALWAGALSMATPAGRGRLWASLVAGVGAGTLFLLSVPTWACIVVLVPLGYAAVAALPAWRGMRRDAPSLLAASALFLAFALAPALAIAVAAAAARTLPTFLTSLQIAMPTEPLQGLAWAALTVLALVLVLDGMREERPRAAFVGLTLALLTGAALATRLVWIAANVTVPSEVFWFDGPFLVNALKLRDHIPLYGPMSELNSYSYSPLIDVLHYALLAPLDLELSIFANRVLILGDQWIAAAILVWAVGPYVAKRDVPWLGAALGLTSFANLVSPGIHPDHPVLVCLAVAFALLVSETRWPRWLWWTALVAVTPIATAFKLSGVGIGIGLFLALLLERRWRALAAVALSLLLAVATVPLFDALFGDFSAYAIRVQAEGTFDWPRLWQLPLSPYGLSAMAAVAYAAWIHGSDARLRTRDGRTVSTRVVALTAGVTLLALPAYLKASGRDNNLLPLLVGSVVIVVVCGGLGAQGRGPRPHPSLPAALTLVFVLAVRPPALPLMGAARERVQEDFAQLTRAVREDAAVGRRTLALTHGIAWIAAGRRDVPVDRYGSAAELFFAHRPEHEELFRHIADGRYDTILVSEAQLRANPELAREFNLRLAAVIDANYERTYPPDGTMAQGAVIFRRRSRPQ